jgi:hypothetical protein
MKYKSRLIFFGLSVLASVLIPSLPQNGPHAAVPALRGGLLGVDLPVKSVVMLTLR